MERNVGFSYHYSAAENEEIKRIRAKYVPKEESKLEELRRLDRTVQCVGMTESLSVGILGCLLFGLDMCFGLKVIGDSMVLAVLFAAVGAVGMLFAYPVQRRMHAKVREKYTPRILTLIEELSDEK